MAVYMMTTTESWATGTGKSPAWARCEPGTHPYTPENFPAFQHTVTDGAGAKQQCDVLARHTGFFEMDLDLYKDGAPAAWEASEFKKWVNARDGRPYLKRGEDSLKLLIHVPEEIRETWWPTSSGLDYGDVRAKGIVPSPGALHPKSGMRYEAVDGPDLLRYPLGDAVYSNVLVLDWDGVTALSRDGVTNWLDRTVEKGKSSLPDNDGRCPLVGSWMNNPERGWGPDMQKRGNRVNKAVAYLKQLDEDDHRIGGWLSEVVARFPKEVQDEFDNLWDDMPVEPGKDPGPHPCCQEILMTFTPPVPQQPGPPVIEHDEPANFLAGLDMAEQEEQQQGPLQPPQTREDKIRAAMLTWTQIRDTPKPEAVIGSWLFKDTLAWIKGPPGGGKSLTAVDMAGCVKTGKSWHGFPVVQGEVLYLVLEGVASIAQRVAAWMACNPDVKPEGHTFSPVPVNLMDNADAAAIASIAYQMQPKLIVVDTQARATPGADENSSKDMGLFVAHLDYIRQACQACVLVVHHEGRSGQHLRGSTALPGAASTIIDAEKAGMSVTLTTREDKGGRQKDGNENPPLTLTMVPAGPGVALSMPTGLDAFAAMGERERQVLDLLRAAQGWLTTKSIYEELKVSRNTVVPVLRALRDAGRIEESQQGMTFKYRLPDLSKAVNDK